MFFVAKGGIYLFLGHYVRVVESGEELAWVEELESGVNFLVLKRNLSVLFEGGVF